jgi:hypothetical protein
LHRDQLVVAFHDDRNFLPGPQRVGQFLVVLRIVHDVSGQRHNKIVRLEARLGGRAAGQDAVDEGRPLAPRQAEQADA